MKMKKACEATSLTERAIRLYLKKNLLTPRHTEDGLIDFSAEDIQHLKDIALLRQLDFTIEQISCMIHEPTAIPEIVLLRMDDAQSAAKHETEVSAILRELGNSFPDSLHALTEQIKTCRLSPSEPDFARFDEISDEQRQRERLVAVRDLSRMEKQSRRQKRLTVVICVFAVLAALTLAFLSQTRIRGFVNIAPVSVTAVDSRTVTLDTGNVEAVTALGRNTITVPYQFFGEYLVPGRTLERSCQLAIELTNFDLIRIGINPLQTLETQSADINNAWMKHILHALFDGDPKGDAVLWVFEPCNLPPLFWPE